MLLAGLGFVVALCIVLRSCGFCCQCQPSRRPERKPTGFVFYCIGLTTIFCSVVPLLTFMLWGYQGLNSANHYIGNLADDVDFAAEQGVQLDRLSSLVLEKVNATGMTCTTEDAKDLLSTTLQTVESMHSSAAVYSDDITGFVRHFEDARSRLRQISPLRVYSIGVPLLLVIIICVFVLLVGRLSDRCYRRTDSWGRLCKKPCTRVGRCCLLQFGMPFFALVILFVATTAGAEYSFGLALGSFCQDVDNNMLTYIKHFGGEVVYNSSRYYIQGNCSNPLLNELQRANQTLGNVSQQLKLNAVRIEAGCNITPGEIYALQMRLIQLESPISIASQLLDAQRVYPYYQKVVHMKACGSIVSGVAWLIVLQYIVGVACFPFLTCAGQYYFNHLLLFLGSGPSVALVSNAPEDPEPGDNSLGARSGVTP